MRGVALFAVLLLCNLRSSEGAEPPTTSPATLPVRNPTHSIALPTHLRLLDAVFSADGKHVYAAVETEAVNLWGAIAYRWPEISSLVLASIALLLLRRTIKRFRRRQEIGVPYCGQCGYCLTGLSSEKCPECGEAINERTRVLGRSIRTGVIVRLTIVGLLLCVYPTLCISQPRRIGGFTDWLKWDSPHTCVWADSKKVDWLSQWELRARLGQVVEVDVATGRITRVLLSRRMHDDPKPTPEWRRKQAPRQGGNTPSANFREIAFSSRSALLVVVNGPTVHVVSPLTGKQTRQFAATQDQRQITDFGLSYDGRTLCGVLSSTQKAQRDDPSRELFAWNLDTGERRTITRLSEWRDRLAYPCWPGLYPSLGERIMGLPGGRIAVVPEAGHVLTVNGDTGAVTPLLKVEDEQTIWMSQVAVVGGRHLAAVGAYNDSRPATLPSGRKTHERIGIYDIDTKELVQEMNPRPSKIFWGGAGGVEFSPSAQWVAAINEVRADNRFEVIVGDPQTGKWSLLLANTPADRFVASPYGLHLMTIPLFGRGERIDIFTLVQDNARNSPPVRPKDPNDIW